MGTDGLTGDGVARAAAGKVTLDKAPGAMGPEPMTGTVAGDAFTLVINKMTFVFKHAPAAK